MIVPMASRRNKRRLPTANTLGRCLTTDPEDPGRVHRKICLRTVTDVTPKTAGRKEGSAKVKEYQSVNEPVITDKKMHVDKSASIMPSGSSGVAIPWVALAISL